MTPNYPTLGLRLVSFLLIGSLALRAQTAPPPSAAAAAPSDEEVVKLPEFTVMGANTVDPYRTEDIQSVARVAGSIMDAPFTVNVVPPELVSDFGANVGYDVNRYFAGVSNGRGSSGGGINDRQDFRGFESFSKTVDDFSSFIIPTANGPQANFDTLFQDRAELVMGPDSILSPTGTPGGSINIITKSPQFTESTVATAEVGNYDANRYTIDSTGPISKNLAFRVMMDYQDGSTYVPGAIRQQNLGLELTYKFNPTTQVTLKYFGEQWGTVGAETNINDNEEQIYLPNTVGGVTIGGVFEPGFKDDGWDGSASWSHRNSRLNIVESEFTTELLRTVSMRLAVQGMTEDFLQDAAYPSVNPAETFNASTGVETAVAADNVTAMPEVGQYEHYVWRGYQIQNDYAANFHPGSVSIQPVVGFSYEQGHEFFNLTAQDKSATDLPPANLLLNYYAPPPPPLQDYTSGESNLPEMGVLEQAYAVGKVGFLADRLIATAGATRTWANINDYTSKTFAVTPTGISPTGPYTDVQLSSLHDSYLGGILAKPLDNVSVYGTYSSNASITASSSNAPLWESGKQYEFGVKSEFFHQRLQVSADHFQITEFNLSTPNPAHNTDSSQPTFLLGNATSKGEEVNVIGGITKNLSVIASLTNQKYRDLFGRRVRNVPDQLANLLVNYRFDQGLLKGANAFVGVVHEGQVAGETVTASTSLGVPELPGFYLRPWTIFNAGAGYGWSRYKVNLNVDNALNSKFLWSPASRQSVSEYPGLTFRATFTLRL
jgi:outer membrane receptor protein involved in Fe transport